MKKLLTIVLTLTMLTTGGAAYAAMTSQGGLMAGQQTQAEGSQVQLQAQKQTQMQNRVHEAVYGQEHRAQMRERVQLIKENRGEINKLREEVKNKIRQVKAKIKDLKKNPDAVSEDTVAEIREKMGLIRSDRAELSGTWGLIREETMEMRLRKHNKDFTGMMGNYNNICSVQEERIEALKKLSADLDGLLAVL